ncbi:MAG: dTDP-4-dehydrorhamnose 3,5-epimerase family protein [bacterium]|nr:dTDP-4-dehydrorhamnose 3,5-epimerase family protein [bacterium]
MDFNQGNIDGVIVKELKRNTDDRGWLIEIFRQDELAGEFMPLMMYVSSSSPGIIRGPHEHLRQTDFFAFLGPSEFTVSLWDKRKTSRTYGNKMEIVAGARAPLALIIPPGIVHGYKNTGKTDGLVINLPNKLYRGPGRTEEVDEVRHEKDPRSPFVIK